MRRREFLQGCTVFGASLAMPRFADAMLLQSGLEIPLPPLPQLGGASLNGTVSGNGVIDPRNYLDQYLPDSCPIAAATYWIDAAPPNQTGGPIPAGFAGNVAFGIDVGGALVTAGWPQLQRFEPILINTLVVAEIFASGNRGTRWLHNPPMDYRPNSGDVINLSPQIGTPDVPASLQGTFLLLEFALNGGLRDLPIPAYLFQKAQDTPDGGGGLNYSIRNLVPGPPIAATQVRFHFNHLYNATRACVVDHASVGIQSGNTSSTIGTPTPLLFATQPAFSIYPDTGQWSDWVNLAVAPSQNLLVTGSLFNAGVNYWSTTINGGLGTWLATSDSWNTADLQGTVISQPTRTHLIDRAQYR